MFEEESEKYANKWLEHVKDLELQHKKDDKAEYIRIKEAHQEGVNFGYNKAKEEGKVVVEHFEAYGQCRDSRRIAGLEQENAELNLKLKNLASVAEVRLANWQKLDRENKELTVQLTKAKEVVRQFLNDYPVITKELLNKLEQFKGGDVCVK